MLKRLKRSYLFNLTHSDTINAMKLTSAPDLINYVIGINNDLIEKENSGWLRIEKCKQTKKGDIVLYATYLDLPILEDNSYFDELLSPFYTRKKLSFDVSGNSAPKLVKEETSVEDSEILSQLEAVNVHKEQPIKKISEENEYVEGTKKELHQEESKQDQVIQQLLSKVEAQEKEIDQLNSKPSQAEATFPIRTGNSTEKIKESEIIVEEPSVAERVSLILASKKEGFSQKINQSDSDILSKITTDCDSQLTQFMTDQLQIIEQEVTSMDTRSTIAKEVSQHWEDKKKRAITVETELLETNLATLLKEEETRYKQAVIALKQQNEIEKDQRLRDIISSYDLECEKEITEENQRQGKAIEEFVSQKKQELTARQEQLSAGLEKNVTRLISSFNIQQTQAIQRLENKIGHHSPVHELSTASSYSKSEVS